MHISIWFWKIENVFLNWLNNVLSLTIILSGIGDSDSSSQSTPLQYYLWTLMNGCLYFVSVQDASSHI